MKAATSATALLATFLIIVTGCGGDSEESRSEPAPLAEKGHAGDAATEGEALVLPVPLPEDPTNAVADQLREVQREEGQSRMAAMRTRTQAAPGSCHRCPARRRQHL